MYMNTKGMRLLILVCLAVMASLFGNGPTAVSGTVVAAQTPATTGSRWSMPTVAVMQNGASQTLPIEKTQIAQTKTKPTSMASLAGDSALNQAIQAGIGDATMATASHITSNFGNSAVQQAGTLLTGFMARRKPTVTYVWGVPNPASTNVLQTETPEFSVDYSHAPGINPNEYEPAIVRLTPAQSTCRLVGATQGKADASSDPAADWQIYSHFVEDRVAVSEKKQGTGSYQLSPASALLPGEYAVVLRPISRSKSFSGGEVARAQGDGLMFDAVWTFQIADSAQ